MNTKEIYTLLCLDNSRFLEDINDKRYITKDILSFLKMKPEYSLETLVFKRYYIPLLILWNDEDLDITYDYFKDIMTTAPIHIYKNDLSCHFKFVLEYYFCSFSGRVYKEDLKNLQISYDLLFEKQLSRIFLHEGIIIARFLRRIIKKRIKTTKLL